MCGICGRLTWGRPAPEPTELLLAMNQTIVHRGPDDDGFFTGSLNGAADFQGNVGLAMRRLSIIDVAGGKQPIENETGDVVVVYNGEVYNFYELRTELEEAGHVFKTRSDTEVIVHGYEVWGDDVAKRLNGMFAFALWDKRRGRLLLARDRMGIKPLYYCVADGRLVFGSEIKALLQDPAVPRDIDPFAVSDYLSLRYIPAPLSIYKSVRKLEPASLLVWEGGQLEKKRYWHFNPQPPKDRGLTYYLEKIDALIDNAVKRQLVSEVPLGTFLSGGLDSTTIAYYAMKHKPDLMTFTMYFDDKHYSERAEAAECAKMLGTHHFEQEVHADVVDLLPKLLDAFDEPFGDDSMIPTYLLCKMARQKMTVALSGDGGDELFAGYRTYIADRLAPFYRVFPGFARGLFEKHILEGAPSKLLPRKASLARNFARAAERPSPYEHFGWTELFKEDVKSRLMSARLREQLNGHSSAESYVKAYKEAGHRRGLERFLYVDQQTHLADEFLVKVDRCSMANSLEVRPPLLDNDVVEFAAEIPEHYKLRGFTTKWLLRRLMKGRLPDSILYGKKRGFGSPMWTWVTGPLLPLLRERFAPARIANNPYLTPEEPNRLLDLVLTGRQELARRVFSLFLFTEWYERHGSGR